LAQSNNGEVARRTGGVTAFDATFCSGVRVADVAFASHRRIGEVGLVKGGGLVVVCGGDPLFQCVVHGGVLLCRSHSPVVVYGIRLMLCPSLFSPSPKEVCSDVDKRCDYDKHQEMPRRYRCHKPVIRCEGENCEERAGEEAEAECTEEKVELVKRYPVFPSFDAGSAFEETFNNVPDEGTETKGEQ